MSNTLGLFKNSALIEEIPKVEVVDNVKLLDGFGPKLLTAPKEEAPPAIVPTLPIPQGDRSQTRFAPIRKKRPPREVN